jgi:hypothetical protein
VTIKVFSGQTTKAELLVAGHRLSRLAEPITASGLDLAEDDDVVVRTRAHEVDLAEMSAPVLLEDLIAVSDVPLRRSLFASAAEGDAAMREGWWYGSGRGHLAERSVPDTTCAKSRTVTPFRDYRMGGLSKITIRVGWFFTREVPGLRAPMILS